MGLVSSPPGVITGGAVRFKGDDLIGAPYEKLRSLYFDISRFAEYGRLSGIDLDKIRLGHTVDLDNYEKDNPRDFTLFKRSRLSEIKRGVSYQNEWGNVRPSWHVQCSAMARAQLGRLQDVELGLDVVREQDHLVAAGMEHRFCAVVVDHLD